MRVLRRKRNVVLLITVLAVLLAAGTAFAFYVFGTTGSGSSQSNDTITTQAVHIDLSANFSIASLAPGGNVPVSVFASNNTPNNASSVGVVRATVSVDATHSGCLASWFSMPGVDQSGVSVPAGVQNQLLFSNGQLRMTDSGTDQSACYGARLTLNLTSA